MVVLSGQIGHFTVLTSNEDSEFSFDSVKVGCPQLILLIECERAQQSIN